MQPAKRHEDCPFCQKLAPYCGRDQTSNYLDDALKGRMRRIRYNAGEEMLACPECNTYYQFREWAPGGSDDAMVTTWHQDFYALTPYELYFSLYPQLEGPELDYVSGQAENVCRGAIDFLKTQHSQKVHEVYREGAVAVEIRAAGILKSSIGYLPQASEPLLAEVKALESVTVPDVWRTINDILLTPTPKPHEPPITAAALTAGCDATGTYIAAMASYSPDPNKVNRHTLYRDKGDELEWCADAWLSIVEAEKLSLMPMIRVGESDAMYAVGPMLVWYHHGNTMKIFSEAKLIFSLEAQKVVLRGEKLSRADIQGVHVYLDRGWVECGVRLVLPDGEKLIAFQENEIASYDITYDGFNLLADTWWARALGRLLSEALGCPYVAEEDLQ